VVQCADGTEVDGEVVDPEQFVARSGKLSAGRASAEAAEVRASLFYREGQGRQSQPEAEFDYRRDAGEAGGRLAGRVCRDTAIGDGEDRVRDR
jgi:hypothetical protein